MPKLTFPSARAFDAGLAALAGLSAGFVTFAMPEPLFSGLVEASRLPDFVPSAQPPLGETARLAAAGAAFLLVFAAVWALMALLGRVPSPRKPAAEPEVQAPRLRRADAHPDAPARRPLLARDLGEPLDLEDFPEAPAEAEPERVEAAPRPLPGFLVAQAPDPEPLEQDEPELAESGPQSVEPELHWAPSEPEWAEAEPEQNPEPETETEVLPISELAAQLPESGDESDQSLSQLASRIEFGLSRKRQALPAALDCAPAEEASEEQEKVGHRLRSAINDLQKIAPTGG